LSIYNITVPDDDDDYDPSNFGMNDAFLPGGSKERDTTPNPQYDDRMSSSYLPGLNSTLLTSQSVPLKMLPPSSTSPLPLSLENTLLAITHAAPNAPLHEIRDASIMGFLYVADVDEKKGKVRVLAPVGGRAPARAMIWGRKWPGELVGLLG